MTTSGARIHDPRDAYNRQSRNMPSSSNFGISNAKLDMSNKLESPQNHDGFSSAFGAGTGGGRGNLTPTLTTVDIASNNLNGGGPTPKSPKRGRSRTRSQASDTHYTGTHENEDARQLRESVEKIRCYDELLDEYSLHQFVIRKGRTLEASPEYISFKRTNNEVWGNIQVVIQSLEGLLQNYAIDVAYVDGQQVIRLAMDEFEEHTEEVLLKCLVNGEQIKTMMTIPGQRFLGSNGDVAAAMSIQSNIRRHQALLQYQAKTKKGSSIILVQRWWRMCMAVAFSQKAIERKRFLDDQRYKQLSSQLVHSWDTIKLKKRVIIHVPSITLDEDQRMNFAHFPTKQNLQMPRLCQLQDPNVDLIYVCPYDLSMDVKAYYTKLLEIGDVDNSSSRFKIIVPENAHRFPQHFPLSTVLLYSPHAMRRIRAFAKNRDAYIVPGMVGPVERELSIVLDIPLMCADPLVGASFGTLSGAKTIFTHADVNIPVGAHDIFDEDDLIVALAKLIAVHLDVQRWTIRADDDFENRSSAYLEVGEIECVCNMRRERTKFCASDRMYWQREDVQTAAQQILIKTFQSRKSGKSSKSFLGSKIVLSCPEAHGQSYKRFLNSICRVGAVVEAMPAQVQAFPCINMFIEPTGLTHVMSTHELILPGTASTLANTPGGRPVPLPFVAAVFPQTNVPHRALCDASKAVAAILHSNGVYGYVSIEYVAFYDGFHKAQRIWATRLHLRLTNFASSFFFFDFVMKGTFDEENGRYLTGDEDGSMSGSMSLQQSSHQKAAQRRLLTGESSSVATPSSSRMAEPSNWKDSRIDDERSYAVVDFLYHPALSTMQSSAFFNLCRLHAVAFDLHGRVGTLFNLVDSMARGVLSIITIGRDRKGSLQALLRTLQFMHDQVGVQNAQSEFNDTAGNFSVVLSTAKALCKKYRVSDRKTSRFGSQQL
jgi:hypothetical protein